LVCLFLSFSFTTAFTIFETVGPLYTAANPYTKWDIFQTSLLFLGISLVSLVALVGLQGLLLVTSDDRKLELLHAAFMMGGMAILFEWRDDGYANMPRMLSGIALVTIGYVNGQALLLSLFSKVLEEHEQGMMMGWLSSAGSVARMSVPIGSSYLWKYVGANYVFLGCSCLLFVAMLSTVVSWKSLLPPSASLSTSNKSAST